MTVLISQDAIDLIVEQEVSNRKAYEKIYCRPTWPGGQSGITIGIGYDIGAGIKDKKDLWDDWKGIIPDEVITALEPCIGVTGLEAKEFLDDLKIINIPWDDAMKEFLDNELPEVYDLCGQALPNFLKLSLDCKGALVSLVYNRGASFNNEGDRYREMRNIKADMTAQNFVDIPVQFRSMKRLWENKGLDGLISRREKEAALFERGLMAMQTIPTRSIPAPTQPEISHPSPGKPPTNWLQSLIEFISRILSGFRRG